MAKFVGWCWLREWSDKLPFYSFKCKKHGQVVNYPSGYSQRLECPLCWKEDILNVVEYVY